MSDTPMLPNTYLAGSQAGTLADNNATTVTLTTGLASGRVAMYRIKNLSSSAGKLYARGNVAVATATAATSIEIEAGEDSGWVVANDPTISLIREAGASVDWQVWVVGR